MMKIKLTEKKKLIRCTFIHTQVREYVERGEMIEAYRASTHARFTARVALIAFTLLKAVIVIVVVLAITQN